MVAEEGLCGFRLRPAVRLRPEDPYQCVCVCARARACVCVKETDKVRAHARARERGMER